MVPNALAEIIMASGQDIRQVLSDYVMHNSIAIVLFLDALCYFRLLCYF